MADIHQWRRKIPPNRSRALEPVLDVEDETGTSAAVSQRGHKPRFFGQTLQSMLVTHRGQNETRSPWPTWSPDPPFPSPGAANLIDAVMRQILANPSQGLDRKFNGDLLHIFEAYRNGEDENELLRNHVLHQEEERRSMERIMERSAAQWDQERGDFKAEVKRLELILAQGQHGLAEVTMARRNSLIRPSSLMRPQTSTQEDTGLISEFWEKTKRFEDNAWSNQRATMRRHSLSSSLAPLRSPLTVYAVDGLDALDLRHAPLEMPLVAEVGNSSLGPETYVRTENGKNGLAPPPVSAGEQSFSEDTFSSSSWTDDICSDDAMALNLIKAAGTDNEFVAIKRIAQILAKRRQLDVDVIMPQLPNLFSVHALQSNRNDVRGPKLPVRPSRSPSSAPQSGSCYLPLRKNVSLRSKASGLLHKLRPQLNLDALDHSFQRRFSFEQGEKDPAAPIADDPFLIQQRPLRRSMSLSSLSDFHCYGALFDEDHLSPIAQSPVSTPVFEPQRATRIPTPVYSSGTLARPRQGREDSTSSLVTAIRCSEEGLRHGNESRSASPLCSPPSYANDLLRGMRGSRSAQRIALSNKLLERTNALRGYTAGRGVLSTASEKTVCDTGPPTEYDKENALPLPCQSIYHDGRAAR